MDSSEESVPLGRPPVRQWELDANHTRYDRLVAAPSDKRLRILWIVWALLFLVFGLFSFFVWLSLVLSKKVRKSPFNVRCIVCSNYAVMLLSSTRVLSKWFLSCQT